ncbi:MAG: DUF169 domain-containing protein [Solirubrobacterales bacterium]
MKSQDWHNLAARLQAALGVKTEPIAISVSNAEAVGADAPKVQAGCMFWDRASHGAFSTTADDHSGCSIGSYTHGLISLAQAAQTDDVNALLETGWVEGPDLAKTASLADRPGAIAYSPLAKAAFAPAAVLVRLDMEALMILADACPELEMVGKPQCQIVPLAIDAGRVVASFGCAVSRTRTGMKRGETTCAIPGDQLADVLQRLEEVATAGDAAARVAQLPSS